MGALARTQALRQRAGMAVEASLNSYRGTDRSRSRVRVFGGGSADVHADRNTRRVLRELSQDLERNAEHYSIFLHGAARLIGAPEIRANTADAEWNRSVAKRFRDRAARKLGGFDRRGLLNWSGLCQAWWSQSLRDGDIATLPLATGNITTVEAEQIDCPTQHGNQHQRTIGGMTVDSAGAVKQVWFAPRDAKGHTRIDKAEPWDAAEVNFMAWMWSTSQTRGVPVMSPGIDSAERVDALVESEIISAEQASAIYGVVKRQLAQGQVASPAPLQNGDEAVANGDTSAPTSATSQTIDYIDWPAGSYLDLPEGLDWENVSQTRPNLDVPDFLRSIIGHSCAQIGIPYAVLYCDFFGINWSGNRGLVSLTRDSLFNLRTTHCQPFIDPLKSWWLADEINTRGLQLPDGLTFAEAVNALDWDWPNRPEWPDPLKEEQTNEKKLQLGTSSLHRIVGSTWDDVLRERHEELILGDDLAAKRIKAAHELAQSANVPGITWRDIVALGLDQKAEPDPQPAISSEMLRETITTTDVSMS